MADGNPLVILELDGVEYPVQFDDVTARDVLALRPYMSIGDLIDHVNDGPVRHDDAAAMVFLSRRQTGTPVSIDVVFDGIKVTSDFLVRAAAATVEPSTDRDASPEA